MSNFRKKLAEINKGIEKEIDLEDQIIYLLKSMIEEMKIIKDTKLGPLNLTENEKDFIFDKFHVFNSKGKLNTFNLEYNNADFDDLLMNSKINSAGYSLDQIEEALENYKFEAEKEIIELQKLIKEINAFFDIMKILNKRKNIFNKYSSVNKKAFMKIPKTEQDKFLYALEAYKDYNIKLNEIINENKDNLSPLINNFDRTSNLKYITIIEYIIDIDLILQKFNEFF